MPADTFRLQDEFPPTSYEQWRALAEADLQGASFAQKLVTHTYEGLDIQPLYTRRDELGPGDPEGFPGFSPFVRGASPLGAAQCGWDLRQEHAHPDRRRTNEAILEDVQGGVTSLLLRFDQAARQGWDPDELPAETLAGRDGIMVYCLDDLDAVLADVDLQSVGIALEAGAAFLPAAAALLALWERRGIAAESARGALGADPFAALARDGELPMSPATALDQLTALARFTAGRYPRVTAVGVDSSPYHHAGATAAQDIAFAVGTAIEYLRAMTAAGMDVDAAAGQILFGMSVGTHHFLSIAKLRAARRVWSRVIGASGGSPAAGAMRLHVRTSQRVLTRRDPYVNLLRNTVGVFAAGVGGAETITSVPFDAMVGLPDSFSRRIARNTALILQEEAHLHRVVDPAGGSWCLDRLTEELADKAWEILQQVEGQGGFLQALQSGWVAAQIDSAFAPRARDIARRKEGITGISEFPDVREEQVLHPAPDLQELRATETRRLAAVRTAARAAAGLSTASDRVTAAIQAVRQGATIGQMARGWGFHVAPVELPSLELRSFAGPFEELRDASDAWLAAHGRRPLVFLANMGPVAHHTARAAFSKNFFEAGGFEVVTNDGFAQPDAATQAFAASGAKLAVICSSDKLYPDVVPQLAPKLKAAGARTVILAGSPGANEQAWRAVGVDRFIFIKCDVLATLRELLREEGVLGQEVASTEGTM